MIKVGDKVHKTITGTITTGHDAKPPKCWGQVVWIHPLGRFYLAEFTFGRGTIRECFTEGL